MKKLLVFCLAIHVAMMSGQSLRVATYNLRFDNPRDSLNAWPHRSDYVTNLILLHDFDIFGTQEGLKHQLEDLKTGLNNYDYIGVGRDDGDTQGEHAAIFYKTDKLKLQSHGDFWLSPVTEKPNKGWDAALPRICTWGRFKDIGSGKEFYLFNVHFDHLGEMARRESAKLIINKIGEIANGIPCILTGDFNFDEHHESYTYLNTSGLLKDTYDLADIRYAPDGTFNGFNVNSIPEGRIDHIFITPAFRVRRYGILTNTYHNRYPSDHFPVFAEIRFH